MKREAEAGGCSLSPGTPGAGEAGASPPEPAQGARPLPQNLGVRLLASRTVAKRHS